MAGIRRLLAAVALSCVTILNAPFGSMGISASAAVPRWTDPAIGPHARDEASHRQDRLQFVPAPTPLAAGPARKSAAVAAANMAAPSSRPLQREVFAFAPYWALSQNTNWNYSMMSTIAYFGLDLYADGTFVKSGPGWDGWNSTNLVNIRNQAHQAGARLVLVIKAFDNATICSVTYDSAQTAINSTIAEIKAKNADGVNVDFEGSNNAPCFDPNSGKSVQAGVTGFMTALSSQVHQQVPGSFVTIDTYSGSASWDSGEFNIGALAPVVDAMFDMAYDMESANMRDANGVNHAGPTAPLNGWTYNDTLSVNQYLTKAPASKVILGVPYYGGKWSTTDNQPYSTTTSGRTAEPYSVVGGDFACAANNQLKQSWDGTASTPWASWLSPATSPDPTNCPAYNSWRELYYDDVQSLGLKYDLVNRTNLRGAGMWALGYDGNAPELWNLIEQKFVSWSGWESLGGSLASGPGVASWASGRLDVFAVGGDGSLIHKWYDGTSWHGWESLGGNLTSDPTAVSWASGRLDVFARGPAKDLIHKWYGPSGWSGWESLGGILNDGPGVASWAAGRLDVFVRGGDNALWHRWYNGGWFGWERLGGILIAGPAAVSMSSGRIDVFGRGGDNALWHRWYDVGGWAWWESLGGILSSGPGAASWGSGRLDVFVRGSDNAMWHATYGTTTGTWSWEFLGGILSSGPGAVSWGVGRVDVFVRGGMQLWHKWFQAG